MPPPKLLVVLLGLLLVPAATAQAAPPETYRPAADCGAVAGQLTDGAEQARATLTAVPSGPARAQTQLGELLAVVAGAQRDGCLPAIPPEAAATACADAVADLLAQLHSVLAALLSTGTPDLPAALEQLAKLLATVGTVVEVCLPADPPATPAG